MPLDFGPSVSCSLFTLLLVIYAATSREAIGDVTATSKISRERVAGLLWMQRIKDGLPVNDAHCLLADASCTGELRDRHHPVANPLRQDGRAQSG